MNYYNEFDKGAAKWLRQLIKDGLIPNGEVDTRDIRDIKVEDLQGYTQHHFFAGIGGWSLALQLAGWSQETPVWTGSPPCQSFSAAGKKKGKDDERHLWPTFYNLIREFQPSTIFGEEVATAIAYNWFDDVRADLEGENYATGMVVLPASSVGAPHKRDRLYYFARKLGNSKYNGQPTSKESTGTPEAGNYNEKMGNFSSQPTGAGRPYFAEDLLSQLGNPDRNRLCSGSETIEATGQRDTINTANWQQYQLVTCGDGKLRKIPPQSEVCRVADGLSYSVVQSCDSFSGYPLADAPEAFKERIKGYGNAIVPQVAAEVIKAFMEA